MKRFFHIMTLLSGLIFSTITQAGIAVIAHPSLHSDSIDLKTLKSIYLGKTKYLKEEAIHPLDYESFSEIKKEFHIKVTKRTAERLHAYWSRMIFSGAATPPKMMPSESALMETVATFPGSIAYVDESKIDDTVKVLLIID